MDEWILDIIDSIESKRREAKIFPVCATFIEVSNACTEEQRKCLKEALNRLYIDGKILVWDGINDTIIQRKKWLNL